MRSDFEEPTRLIEWRALDRRSQHDAHREQGKPLENEEAPEAGDESLAEDIRAISKRFPSITIPIGVGVVLTAEARPDAAPFVVIV